MKSSTELYISSHSWGKKCSTRAVRAKDEAKRYEPQSEWSVICSLEQSFSSRCLITPTRGALTCPTGAVQLSQCSLEIRRFSAERHY